MIGIFELHIRCADCGCNLELVYEKDADKEDQKTTKSTKTSGAFKVESSLFVNPCKVCMKPADEVINAIKVINKYGGVR